MVRSLWIWLGVLGVLAGILLLSTRALVPPAAVGRDAPPDQFSEGRARDVLRVLTEDIGHRVNGTQGYRKAVAYLAAELGKIPGVEVQIQEGSGTNAHRFAPWAPFVFRVTNVLGRLPGKSSDAILLDAHFDTLTDSVGAADDGAGVVAVVDLLRTLAHERPLDRSIIVNLNGGEERGGLGALAFLDHPWAKDVRAYIYLEALPGGRAALIGSGPGQPWLAKTFAATARLPLGNIVAQDLARSGLLPFDGDFTPFHKAGLVGLDIAMVGDAWGVHTPLDRLDRLEPGGLQHMGDAALASARALTSSATPLVHDPRPVVYYDILGHTMLAYSMTVARWLGAVALVLFVAVVFWLNLRRRLRLREVLGAWLWSYLSLGASMLAAILAALILRLLQRPNGWFSMPILLVGCFALPAAAAGIFVGTRWRKRAMRKLGADDDRLALVAWCGANLFWAVLLLLATVAGVASGYLALFWVLSGALAIAVGELFPRVRILAALLGCVPGAVVTIELATLTIANIVPMTGLFPPDAPTDVMLAVLVGLATGLVGIVAWTIPERTNGNGKAATALAALGLAGIAATALHFPYSAHCPKRVLAAHAADGQKSALLLASSGLQGMAPLLSRFPGLAAAPSSWPSPDFMAGPITHMLPAGAPAMPEPAAEARSSSYDPATDTRTVELHLRGTSPVLKLFVPGKTLVSWAASATLSPLPPSENRYAAQFEGVDERGVDFRLVVRGQAPVEVELRAIDGALATGPEIDAVRKQLPDWATLHATAYRITRLTI